MTTSSKIVFGHSHQAECHKMLRNYRPLTIGCRGTSRVYHKEGLGMCHIPNCFRHLQRFSSFSWKNSLTMKERKAFCKEGRHGSGGLSGNDDIGILGAV